jgi:hypothetical protein
VIYLYGIIDGCEAPDGIPLGVEDREPYIVPYQGLSAVAGELRHGRPRAEEALLRKHFSILETLMAHHTVLPVRFGATFTDQAELAAYLALSHASHAAILRRLRGQFEVSVRVAWPETAACTESSSAFLTDESGPGARYLAEKFAKSESQKSSERKANEVANVLLTSLMHYSTSAVWRLLSVTPSHAGISMAFLLYKDRLIDFRAALSKLTCVNTDLGIFCTGPWPPYSFIDAVNTQKEPNRLWEPSDAKHENRAFS